MTHPYFSQSIARERERAVRAGAARARLAAIATCCRPSRIAATLRMLRDRMTARRAVACC